RGRDRAERHRRGRAGGRRVDRPVVRRGAASARVRDGDAEGVRTDGEVAVRPGRRAHHGRPVVERARGARDEPGGRPAEGRARGGRRGGRDGRERDGRGRGAAATTAATGVDDGAELLRPVHRAVRRLGGPGADRAIV